MSCKKFEIHDLLFISNLIIYIVFGKTTEKAQRTNRKQAQDHAFLKAAKQHANALTMIKRAVFWDEHDDDSDEEITEKQQQRLERPWQQLKFSFHVKQSSLDWVFGRFGEGN